MLYFIRFVKILSLNPFRSFLKFGSFFRSDTISLSWNQSFFSKNFVFIHILSVLRRFWEFMLNYYIPRFLEDSVSFCKILSFCLKLLPFLLNSFISGYIFWVRVSEFVQTLSEILILFSIRFFQFQLKSIIFRWEASCLVRIYQFWVDSASWGSIPIFMIDFFGILPVWNKSYQFVSNYYVFSWIMLFYFCFF